MTNKRTAVALMLAALLCLSGCRFGLFGRQEETTSPTQPQYVTDINGKEVPVFENVELSSFDPVKFVRAENGRMTYSDPSFDAYTGVDVSVFQEDVDWNAVAADGISFAMLRIGGRGYGPDGEIYEDGTFEANYAGARAAGLKVGVYFFSQAVTIAEAAEEAKFVLKILNGRALDFPVAFDWEHVHDTTARTANIDTELVTSFAKAFCDAMSQAGYQAVIYFNREHGYFGLQLSLLSAYHFWYAEYADMPSFIYDYRIWQYTEEGKVNGISGNVDLNIALYPASG
jgi:GH25 family lysozyme M1 (1,4-beta-N-acetylmuramidase)